MKRISFPLFVISLTFALGVGAVLVWLNYKQLPAKTVESNAIAESNSDTTPAKPKTAESELAVNRQLWQESKITSYSFVSTQFAEGLYPFVPVQIKVVNSKTISTKPTREKGQLERIDGYDKLNTIEKMFDEIQAAIDRGDDLTVTYNKEFGFPEKISMSPGKRISSAYYRMEVTKFEITETN